MPIKWTPELDSINATSPSPKPSAPRSPTASRPAMASVRHSLYLLFLKLTLADCTPKAVENRLYSWKKKNLPAAPSTGNTPSSTPKTPKTPKVRAKATPKKIVLDESEEGGPEGLLESPSPSVKRTSAKRQRSASKVVYVETDGSDVTEKEYIPYGGTKKIKREYAEDEGEVGFATAEEV
ncbi:hypothetical protein HBH75_179850 [Parastagonospora nodorum]|nr:hypothetical protein HBH75_179850 [Parastagonospora nodorum]